jgi:hypothetical protein
VILSLRIVLTHTLVPTSMSSITVTIAAFYMLSLICTQKSYFKCILIVDLISRLPLHWQRHSRRISTFSQFDLVHLHADCTSWSRSIELDWLYYRDEYRRLVQWLSKSAKRLIKNLQFTSSSFSLYFRIYSGLEVLSSPSISAFDRAHRTRVRPIFDLTQPYAWPNQSWK